MRLVILMAVTCFMCSCLAKNKQERKSFTSHHISRELLVDVDSLIKAMPPDGMTEVIISYDPNVPGPKRYKGIGFGEQLRKILQQHRLSARDFDVVMICKDGYAPVRHATELLETPEGYIVFKDLDAGAGRDWTKDMEKGFSPFYLVWKTDTVSAGNLPWPYGLVSLKFIERDSLLLTGLSRGAEVMAGYHLFRRHCSSCHSINKTGGQVGPEMNLPQNITEYWTDNNIKHYIKDPQSFRYNAHMPAMKHLADEEIEALIRYLHYMKKHKVP